MIKVLICHSPSPRVILEEELVLSKGASLRDALLSLAQIDSTLFMDYEAGTQHTHRLKAGYKASIWSKQASFDQVLQDLDRIEVLRPIKVDPKVARRERFKKQGTKGAGLFAKTRPGAKAGY